MNHLEANMAILIFLSIISPIAILLGWMFDGEG